MTESSNYFVEPSEADALRDEMKRCSRMPNETLIYYSEKLPSGKSCGNIAIYREGGWDTTAQPGVRQEHHAFMNKLSSFEVTFVCTLKIGEKVK